MEGGRKTGDLSVFLRLDEARETLAKGERELESLKQTQVKLDLLSSQEAHGGDSQETGSQLCNLPLIEQLSWLDRASQHVTWCQTIEKIGVRVHGLCKKRPGKTLLSTVSPGSSVLEKSFSPTSTGDSKSQAAPSLSFDEASEGTSNAAALVHCHKLLTLINSSLIADSKCRNLRGYALNMLAYTRHACLTAWVPLLEGHLQSLDYPKCVLAAATTSSGGFSRALEDNSKVRAFAGIYRALVDLAIEDADLLSKLPDHLDNPKPLDIVLKPLVQRFKYHFMGSKKTNNPLKPEWYLQQVSQWIRFSQPFFEKCVAPAAYGHGKSATSSFPGHTAFCLALLTLVNKKLKNDLPLIIDDDVHLSHLIDEVLFFCKEVTSKTVTPIPPLSLPINVLLEKNTSTQTSVLFNRWIDLERKFAFEKIDELMMKESSWSCVERDLQFQISRCAETFVALLQSITNRYKGLSDVTLQLQFIQLQCDLIEDLRLRFAQILREQQSYPLSEKFCLMLGSSQYLIDILNTWSELPLFLRLTFERERNSSKEPLDAEATRGLFSTVISHLEFQVGDLIQIIVDHIFYEVKARSKGYRREIRWFSFKSPDKTRMEPSPESYGMFQVLSASLETVAKYFGTDTELMTDLTCRISRKLDEFFIVDVVLENKFSSDGAAQFDVDVKKGLRAVFDQYGGGGSGGSMGGLLNLKSHHQLLQVCGLLILARGSAILLKDSLADPRQTENASEILAEFAIDALSAEQAVKVLDQRVDLQ